MSKPNSVALRPHRGDLVGADAGLDRARSPRPSTPAPCVYASRWLAVALPTRERPVVAGPVAVVGVDDVEERLVTRPDQPVGEVVRVRVAPLAGDRVDRLDLVGAHLVEPLVGQRDDLVLPDAGLERLDDVLVDAVDHRRGLVEQHDLVGDLICRASSMSCWASTTCRPWRCISNRNGGSTMSTPTGAPATPASSSMPLISRTASSISPTVGAIAPRRPSMPGVAVLRGAARASRAGGAWRPSRSPTASARRHG